MEENPKSFYSFLSDNIKSKQQSDNKTNTFTIILSWCVIFIVNSALLYVCWNNVMHEIFKISTISFTQSIMVYTITKILTRGIFTIQ